jgi:hypothetical protein
MQFAALEGYNLQLMDPDNSFSQLLWADVTLHAPLLSLKWQKQQIINGREETMFQLSEFEYHHLDNFPTIHFDSLVDYMAGPKGVFFLPILGDGHVTSDLIVRLVSSGH